MKIFVKIFAVLVIAVNVSSSPVLEEDEPAAQFTLLICQNWMVLASAIHGDLNTELTNSFNHFIDFIYSYHDLNIQQPRTEFKLSVDAEFKHANASFISALNIAKIKIAKKFNIKLEQADVLLGRPEKLEMPFSCVRHILCKMADVYDETVKQAVDALNLLAESH